MKTRQGEVLIRILNLFKSGNTPLTISEISKSISSNWETTNSNLEVLKKLGYINKINNEYILIKPFELDENTFFKIPIDKKSKNTTESIFALLQNLWFKKTKKRLDKTRAHKYAFEIAKQFKLEVPCLWYKFGAIMLLEFNPAVDYEITDKFLSSEQIRVYTERLINDTKDLCTADLRNRQYVHKELYKCNKLFYETLLKSTFTKEEKLTLKERLYSILFRLEKTSDNSEVLEMVNAFSSIFLILLKEDMKYLREIHADIIRVYDDLWSLIALRNAYETLANCGYPKEFLSMYIDFDTCIKLVDQSLCEFRDMIKTPLDVLS